jgi:hypothetical protein
MKNGLTSMKFGLAAVSILWLAGCGGGASDLPPLAKVSGIVNFKDAPLVDATVTFYPEKGPISMGKTDAKGAYQLRTNGQLGAVVGNHKVTVSSADAGGDPPPMDGKEMAYAMKSTLPKKYASPETTDLQVVVPDSGNANLVLDLTE